MPCNLAPSTKRRKALGHIALLFALIALALTALPKTSFAGTDTAGNVLATEVDSNPSGVEGEAANRAIAIADVINVPIYIVHVSCIEAAEAIARGLEGEVQVLLVIDENGQVVATRLEQGSGHAILDEAALRAARSLKSLPADAPRQTVLPIPFRLK